MQHIPMYRGQGIIYPSMYSLNILLCNKDYKTSKYYSQMSILYRHITQGINYTGCHVHTEGKIPRGLALSANLEAPLETSLATLGRQKQLLTLLSVDGQPPLPYALFCFSSEHRKNIFSCLTYLASLSQPNCSFKKMEMKSQLLFQNTVCTDTITMLMSS